MAQPDEADKGSVSSVLNRPPPIPHRSRSHLSGRRARDPDRARHAGAGARFESQSGLPLRGDPDLGGGLGAESELSVARPKTHRPTDLVHFHDPDPGPGNKATLVQVLEERRGFSLRDFGDAGDDPGLTGTQQRERTLVAAWGGVPRDGVAMG